MLILCVALVILVGLPGFANATYCAHDSSPAASLLFPFVVFDYGHPYTGPTTVITLTNLSSRAQIVHVDLWTDYALPVLGFNMVLTGYDVETFNIRDILLDGQLPVTTVDVHRELEGVMTTGPVSQGNAINEDWLSGMMGQPQDTASLGQRCTPGMGGYPGDDRPIPGDLLQLLLDVLTRSQTSARSFSDACTLTSPGAEYQPEFDPWLITRGASDPTWMYITVDVVNTCDAVSGDDEAYWRPSSEGGQARYENVLTGDVYWLSSDGVAAAKAVHLEADPALLEIETEADPVTFYARYSTRTGGTTDTREPLPTAWALRYFGAGDPDFSPRFRVFKGATDFLTPFDLEVTPDDEPADRFAASNCFGYTVYSWDEDENVEGYDTPPWGITPDYIFLNLMPLATQEAPVAEFPFTSDSGWLLVVWPPSNYGQTGSPAAPDNYQTWMGVVHKLWGDSVFVEGTPMANANCDPEQIIPNFAGDVGPVDE